MGSPVSPIVANIYMEAFEEKALASAPHPPTLWYRYVDDTFTLIHEYHIDEFTDHINKIDRFIKFTREPEVDGKLPFLDVCVHVNPDATTKTTVYRKATHTDQYLNFQSNHPLEHKRSVVRTLLHRADSIVSSKRDKKSEVKHVKTALHTNGYPKWAFHVIRKPKNPPQQTTRKHLQPVGLPYMKGTSEKLKRVFRKYGANIYHVPTNTLRANLVRPKDPATPTDQCGVVYRIDCTTCQETYIGETARALGIRLKEHKNVTATKKTAVGEHQVNGNHVMDWDNVRIVKREDNTWKRKIKEALVIQETNPKINQDAGAEIPPIYKRLLSRGRPRPRDDVRQAVHNS